MGLISSGIPQYFVNALVKNFSIRYFIETGTCRGETASWASQQFEKVFTIEKSEELWQASRNALSNHANVVFLLGDSREKLGELVSQLSSPALFWLDAHWSGGKTYGKGDECPLIGELEVINTIDQDNFILIDDARLFMFPPPHPHLTAQWPTISQVLKLLDERERYTIIFDDVFVAIPNSAKPLMVDFYQDLATDHWEKYLAQRLVSPKPSLFSSLKKSLRTIVKSDDKLP